MSIWRARTNIFYQIMLSTFHNEYLMLFNAIKIPYFAKLCIVIITGLLCCFCLNFVCTFIRFFFSDKCLKCYLILKFALKQVKISVIEHIKNKAIGFTLLLKLLENRKPSIFKPNWKMIISTPYKYNGSYFQLLWTW